MNGKNYHEDHLHKNDTTLINFNQMAKITSTPLAPLQQRGPNSFRNESSVQITRRYSLSDIDFSIKKGTLKARNRVATPSILRDNASLFKELCHNMNNANVVKKPTHQEKYDRPGLFPVVHLFKDDPLSNTRLPTKIEVKPFPSGYSHFHNGSRDITFGASHTFPTEPSLLNPSCSYNPLPPNVLEALKDISRKRVHSGEDCEITEQKRKKIDLPNDTNVNAVNKRQREESHLLDSLHLDSPPPIYKKRCIYDEYTASKSSMNFSFLFPLPNIEPIKLKRKTVSTATDMPQQQIKQLKLVNAETQTVPASELDNDTFGGSGSEKKEVEMSVRVFDDNKLHLVRNQRLAALMGNLARKRTTVLSESNTDELDSAEVINKIERNNAELENVLTPKTKLTSILSTPKTSPANSTKHVHFNLPEEAVAATPTPSLSSEMTQIKPTSPSVISTAEPIEKPVLAQTFNSIGTPIVSTAISSKDPVKSSPINSSPKSLFTSSFDKAPSGILGIQQSFLNTTSNSVASFTSENVSVSQPLPQIQPSPPKVGGFSFDLKTGTQVSLLKVPESKTTTTTSTSLLTPTTTTTTTTTGFNQITTFQSTKPQTSVIVTSTPLTSNFVLTKPSNLDSIAPASANKTEVVNTNSISRQLSGAADTTKEADSKNMTMIPITTSSKSTSLFRPAAAGDGGNFTFGKSTFDGLNNGVKTELPQSTTTSSSLAVPAFSFTGNKTTPLISAKLASTTKESEPNMFKERISTTAASISVSTTTPFAFGTTNSVSFSSPFGSTPPTPSTTATIVTQQLTFTSPFAKSSSSESTVSTASSTFGFQNNKNTTSSTPALTFGTMSQQSNNAVTPFGSSTTATTNYVSSFGSGTTAPVFGSSSSTTFGTKSAGNALTGTTSLFAAPQPSTQQSSLFGAAATGFNSNSTTSNLFKPPEAPGSATAAPTIVTASTTPSTPFVSNNIFGSSIGSIAPSTFSASSTPSFNAPSVFPIVATASQNNTFGTGSSTTNASPSPFQFGGATAPKATFGGFGTAMENKAVTTPTPVFGSGAGNSAFAKPATQEATTAKPSAFGSGFGNANSSMGGVFGGSSTSVGVFGSSNANQPSSSNVPATTNAPFSFAAASNPATPFGSSASTSMKPAYNFTGSAGMQPASFNTAATPTFGASSSTAPVVFGGTPGLGTPSVVGTAPTFGAAAPGGFSIGASSGSANRNRLTQRAKRRT